MKRREYLMAIWLLLLFTTLACGQAITSPPTALSEPTATPNLEPTATSIPGWERFEGGGAELWLPQSFEGGDISEDIDVVVENLRRLGPDFEQIAQMIEQNPSMYAIWAFDSDVGGSGFLTSVNVIKEQVLSAITPETYLDMALPQFPPQFQVVEQDILSVGNYQAGRVVIEFAVSAVPGKEVMYVIKNGNTMWVITFATAMDEYDQRLPVFEQSVLTFKVQD